MNNAYRPHVLVVVSVFALWLTGCTARVHGHAYADVPEACCVEPELVEIQPELWVVCHHHSAAYYHYGSYWHHESGIWWQSATWGGPRIRVQVHAVPTVIVHQNHQAYVQFRGHANARRHPGPTHGATGHRPAAHRTEAHWVPETSSATYRSRRPVTRNQSRPRARAQRPSAPRSRPVARTRRPAVERPRAAVRKRSRTEPKRPAIDRPRPRAQQQRQTKPSRAVNKRPRRPARQDDKRKKRRTGRR